MMQAVPFLLSEVCGELFYLKQENIQRFLQQ
jgi:hypothetical protein